ncbi:hypothetical protein SAY86_022202 [Trapa natans]|uniref:Uncharacterized protein n=1 Tax=Trapa natans TaxID=22666 RepID=A0AAN7MTL4_TRANT|nr:hypothetical protein SAY86_022202 [Trapa natans]
MKKQKTAYHGQQQQPEVQLVNPFEILCEEIVFSILDFLDDNPLDKKSFSLACKAFHSIERSHRRALRPLRPNYLPKILSRYRNAERLDLTLCPRVTDASLSSISSSCGSVLRYINLSRSRFFSGTGLSRMVAECRNLVEIDLSNATDLRDAGVAALAAARNLEQLWLRRVELVAVKCNDIRTLDLSYLRISSKCLSPILKLQYLEDLILEGCFGLDNDSLAALKHGHCSSCSKFEEAGYAPISQIRWLLSHMFGQ